MLVQIKNRIITESSLEEWNDIRSDLADELFIFLIDQDLQPFLNRLEENLSSYGLSSSVLTDLETDNPTLELPYGTEGAEDSINETGVIPENEWIVKYKNGELIPCLHKIVMRNSGDDLTVNATETPLQHINKSVNIQRENVYKVTVSFNYSCDSTKDDFIATLTFGGIPATARANNEIFRIESKDSSGDDYDGRGTNRKRAFNQVYYFTLNTIGSKNIILSYYCNNKKVKTAMWNASVEIEECI